MRCLYKNSALFDYNKGKTPGNNGYRGLIVDSTYGLALNSCFDANFSELWVSEVDKYSSCVKIHIGFVIPMGSKSMI